MRQRIARLLLVIAVLIYGGGALLHAAAYRSSAMPGIDGSTLAPFLASELKALWLADSTTLLAIAVILGFIVARPAAASPILVMLLALVPLGTAALLYGFLGPFFPGHMLLAASIMVVVAGSMLPARAGAA